MNKIVILLLITALFPLKALAANKDRNFAVKGLAAASCATFVEEREKRSQTYAEAMAWLTGYISAYNYLKPNTYDIAPLRDMGKKALKSA